MNQKQLEAREKALKKAAIYQRLFNTTEGKVILDDLKAEFERTSLVHELPHIMHVRAGELNVIHYIERVLEVDTTTGNIGEENA